MFLLSTGELVNGKEELVYIKSLNCDNVNQVISGEYLRLMKNSEEEFEIIAPTNRGAFFKYSLVNNRPFLDIDGVEVYVLENGEIKMAATPVLDNEGNPVLDEAGNPTTTQEPVSRLTAYDDNIGQFGAALATVMLISIKSHLGYHPLLGA